jgi:hypothetical protein
MKTWIRRIFGIIACALLLAGVAAAQETTATITGVVTDDTGGVLPGVTVVAKHLATGRTFQFVSTTTGAYTATLLPIGEYELTFELSGFQPTRVTGIRLNVNDRVDISPKLRVSGVAETVQVTAEKILIQPTPAVQTLVGSKQILELPLNNRNFALLPALSPGVANDMADEVGIGLTSTMSLSVNGARRNALNWLVDGVSNVDVGSNITLLSTPTLDSIEEFKVITSSYQAEWPRSGGGIVNVVTKSGTNRFTGSGYEYMRNDGLNANTFFRQFSSDPAVNSQAPFLRYNNFGYTAGGPVPVRQDKLFFFWSEEWRRITRAPASLTATVPDPTWLTDPTSSNYVPPAQRDPNAVKLLAAWPAPNVAGKNQYLVSSPNINNTRQEVIRMDYDLSTNWRLTGRYTHDMSLTRELGGLWYGTAVPGIATTDTTVPGHVFALAARTIVRSNMLNELSYQRSGNAITNKNPAGTKGLRSDYGINISEVFAENATNRIPSIGVTGLSSIGSMQPNDINYVNHTITDNFSWLRGNHQFKMGGMVTFEAKNENAANVTQGSFSFGATTGGPTAFQSFLRGNYDGKCTTNCTYTEAEKDITLNLRFNRYEMYAQDTWRAKRNLTLDIGLRYALYPPVTDVNNRLVTFDPTTYDPAAAPPFANATGTLVDYTKGNKLNGLIVAGVNSPYGRAIYAIDKNSFQPRVGLSWDPTGNGATMLRGAFGVYFDQPLIGIFEQNSFVDPPFVNNISLTGITLSNPAQGTTTTTSGVRSLTVSSLDFQNPRTLQWNITVSRRLFDGAALEVGYVGSRGDNLIRPNYLNYPAPADVVAYQTQTGTTAVNPIRPYRSYGDITIRQTTAISRYNGLLSSFRWNAGDKGTLNVSYTLSHNQTDATNDRDSADFPQNPADPMADYADARTDRRHIFVASYVYEIPFFRNSSNFLLKGALGGWQIAGITNASSGQPVPYILVSTNGYRRGKFANIVGDPNVGQMTGVPAGYPATQAGYYFDPAAFTTPADGTFGNSGRAPFRQPGFYKWDLTLSKNFYFSNGSRRVQFRADFINAFNHVNWASDPTATGLDNTCTYLVTYTAGNCNAVKDTNDRFGQLIAARQMREIQFGLKLFW